MACIRERGILLGSDSKTTIGKVKEVDLIENNTAKARRFTGWPEELSFLTALNIRLLFLKGEINYLADLLSRSIDTDSDCWVAQTSPVPCRT
jgi:hypothetical protein